MKKIAIMNSIKNSIKKVKFGCKKRSPEILMIVGGIGVVASAIMACKATLAASDILDEGKETIDIIKETKEKSGAGSEISYTEKDYKRDLTGAYVKTTLKVASVYATPVVLGVLSMSSMVGSNMILRKRNAGLAAAYVTIDKSFKEYRGRVVNRFGERADYELRHDIKAIETKEKVKDEEGKTKTVKNKVDVLESDKTVSDYVFIFNQDSRYYEKNMEYNLMFVGRCERFANDRLNKDGYLFLNDVREMFGLPKTKVGQVVGWVKDSADGDNYVDLGYHELCQMHSADFSEGYDKALLIDPNVQGTIWDKIIY